MKNFSVLRFVKRLFDSNEAPWMLPLPPWYPARHRQLRRLRQLARRRLRTELIARQGWFATYCQLLVWPFMAVLKSILAVRSYNAAWPLRIHHVAATTWLQWAHNLRIADQENHHLTKSEWRKEVTGYIPCREHQALMALCTPQKPVAGYPQIFTKLPFNEFCVRHNLPTAPRLAWGHANKCEGLQPLPHDDLVLKPAAMGKGIGVEILSYCPLSEQWRGTDGRLINAENLAAYAHERLGDNDWLIQPRLRNADAWSPFTPGALATARLVTGRMDATAAPILIGGYLRMPRAGVNVDNLCQGGIGALLNIETGIMGMGLTYNDCFDEFAFHPDTGARIAGVALPGFTDLVNLTLRAHAAAGIWPSIGWDVALLNKGPVLVEANLHWAIIPGAPITQSSYLEITENGLERAQRMMAA